MSATRIERITVLLPNYRTAYTATPQQARQLLRAGLAQVLGDSTKYFDKIQLVSGPVRPRAGKAYSHKEETDDNPKNVWTLLPSRSIGGRSIEVTSK